MVLLKEIFQTYFTSNTLAISEEERERIRDHFKSSEILDTTIFQKGANEIMENALGDRPLKDKLKLFFQSCMYKHRMAKQDGNLPDSLFTEVVKYIKNSEWKEFHNKNDVTIAKGPYPGVSGMSLQETAIIYCRIEDAFDIVWDTNRRHEWLDSLEECHIVEKLSPQTEIVYQKVRGVGIRTDFCFAQSKKTFDDGSIIIVGCSVDHKDAPIAPKYQRGSLDLFTYFMEPHGANCFKMSAGYQINLDSYGKLTKMTFKNEWFLKTFGARIKSLRNCLQKEKKKQKIKKNL